jgi:hypothetical protein
MTKSIGDNYKIYGLIIVKIPKKTDSAKKEKMTYRLFRTIVYK